MKYLILLWILWAVTRKRGGFCSCGGGGAGDSARQLATQQQKQVNQAMKQVDQAFAGYTPAFYDQQRQAYLNAALPQLGQQATQEEGQLGFKLANQGLLQSSAGQRLGDLLGQEITTQKQNVSDAATQASQNLQRQVENYRNQVVGQVQQAVDPTATAASALGAAATFAAPSAAPQLGNLFGNWAQQYLGANTGSPPVYNIPGFGASYIPPTSYGSGIPSSGGSASYDVPADFSGAGY